MERKTTNKKRVNTVIFLFPCVWLLTVNPASHTHHSQYTINMTVTHEKELFDKSNWLVRHAFSAFQSWLQRQVVCNVWRALTAVEQGDKDSHEKHLLGSPTLSSKLGIGVSDRKVHHTLLTRLDSRPTVDIVRHILIQILAILCK